MFQPKSILKPAVPLTPPKVIPSFDELRKKDTGKAQSPVKNGAEELLIDFSTPGTSRQPGPGTFLPGTENLVDPFSPIARPGSKDGVEQHQQAVEEGEQQRQQQKKAVMEQRAARRKSLANRRVSFAPEATLHTWSVMELMEDSTTSSAANSTRRQSAMTAAQSPMPSTTTPGKEDERPSTPTEQHNDEVVKDTPDSQRELHQRKRRRTSDLAQSSDDETFSSPGDGDDSSPIRVEDSIDSESDTDGDTAMSLDEATQNTVRSSGSSSTQTSLDERLRQAASQAGTNGIGYDEHGPGVEDEDEDDRSMEIADGTVTHAFRQYTRKDPGMPNTTNGDADKENIKHYQNGSTHSHQDHEEDDEDDATMGMTMEMTRAVGGIVTNGVAKPAKSISDRRRSNASQRSSSAADSSHGDETMDMTVAKGGILSDYNGEHDIDDQFTDEEMTMEMTKAIGGIRKFGKRESLPSIMTEETESMDMTVAAGGILPPIEEQTEPQSILEGDMTGAMDMTRAVGKILPQQESQDDFDGIVQADAEQPTPSAQLEQEMTEFMAAPSSMIRSMATVASETGSPTLKPRLSARRPAPISLSTTPKSAMKMLSPQAAGEMTPSKQLTPAAAKSTSPKRTPMLTANVTTRGASPKKLFAKEIQQRASPAGRKSPRKSHDPLFSKDEATGLHTPKVVLRAPKPHQHLRRRSSGVGVDNEGTGSPRVSEILSRRESIGEGSSSFQLQKGSKRQIHFGDPRQIEHDIDTERAEEHRRESGRFIMEQEASEQQEEETTTQNLKEMIQSMTPKKNEQSTKVKGRKSLAVGSARGLLGKRPAELDGNEDDEGSTPKRLKTVSREGSPIKKVHLPKPPTKEETTGRLSRAEQLGIAAAIESAYTPTLSQSPVKKIKSPSHTGRFRNPPSAQKPASFEERLDNVVGATDITIMHPEAVAQAAEEEKISLQQFLNMTNVHFIELSTTKRRHTMARQTQDTASGEVNDTSQASFVAAATTLPLLEMYQHATRELKNYISSGRDIIRQIEAETFAEQPAIFKEYVDARPEIKAVMDNQFRNGKTSARLQSKEGWYTWRGQLVDGLQNGLEKEVKTPLEHDKQVLLGQQDALDQVVPQLTTKKHRLELQVQDLRRRLDEFESLDHEELKEKRKALRTIDQEVSQRSEHLSEFQQQVQEKDDVLSSATELRQEMQDQINEALRVQEEQRRWPAKDVANYKSGVQKLEQETGWKLLTAEEDVEDPNDLGVALTLKYRDQLRLFFYPSAFQAKRDGRRRSGRKSRSVSGPTAPISLTYSPDQDGHVHPKELPAELRFFLQLIQSQLHAFTMMPKGSVSCQTLLKTVSEGWPLARKVAEEIASLSAAGIVNTSILSDEKLGAKLMLMQPGRSRIDIEFALTASPLNDGEISTSTSVSATPVYGPASSIMDASRTRKVQHALSKEVESKTLGEGSWISAVRGFEEWLQAQVQAEQQEALKPKLTIKAQPKPASQEQPEPRRATTASPKRAQTLASTTPKHPPRSPLAPKTTNSRIQKKALPVPKKPVQLQLSSSQQESMLPQPTNFRESQLRQSHHQQKENFVPASTKTNGAEVEIVNGNTDYDDVFAGSQPAIPPQMQEAMMYTPVKKRLGALRRSPI